MIRIIKDIFFCAKEKMVVLENSKAIENLLESIKKIELSVAAKTSQDRRD